MRLVMLILLCSTTIISVGQTKPNKKQTIEFIKDYFETNNKIIQDDTKEQIINSASNIQVTMLDSFRLKFSWIEEAEHYTHSILHTLYEYTTVIDFSKVEEIYFSQGTNSSGGCEIFRLVLKSVKSYEFPSTFKKYKYPNSQKTLVKDETSSKREINIPFACVFNNNLNSDQHQLFKAMLHLRKLCGAPDPIKF